MNHLHTYTSRRGSLSRLAKESATTVSALCEYRSEARRPSYATAVRIAKALGADVVDVFPAAHELQGAPGSFLDFPRPEDRR